MGLQCWRVRQVSLCPGQAQLSWLKQRGPAPKGQCPRDGRHGYRPKHRAQTTKRKRRKTDEEHASKTENKHEAGRPGAKSEGQVSLATCRTCLAWASARFHAWTTLHMHDYRYRYYRLKYHNAIVARLGGWSFCALTCTLGVLLLLMPPSSIMHKQRTHLSKYASESVETASSHNHQGGPLLR